MKTKILAMAALLCLCVAPALLAQGRGGQGQRGQQGQGPRATGQQQRGGQQQQQQQGQQTQTREQQRQRIHVTDQQRNQFRTCTLSADRVRTQARQMAQAAKGGGANNPEFRQQHQQLREQIRMMQQEHDRFMNGLSEQQRDQLQDRIRKMDQARERVHTQSQALDQEIGQPNPNGGRLEKRAREMEKATKEWQKQYRTMAEEMGIEP